MIPAELVVGVGLALLAAAIWVTQPMTTWLDRRRAERAERLAFLAEVRLLPESPDGSPVFVTLVDVEMGELVNPPTPPSSPLTPAERRVAVTELIAAKALAPFFAAWTALVERDGAE